MAVRFDNAADELKRTTGIPTATSFTMMGWFYMVSAPGSTGAFLSTGNSGSANYFEIYTDASRVMGIWNGSSGSPSGSTLSLTTWYHIAIAVSGSGAGQCLGYVNGVLDITHAGNAGPTMNALSVGTSVDSADDFNGRAAAVKVWDAPLSAAEILQEMRQVLPVRLANFNSFYPLYGSGDVVDYSGNARTFTVGGTLTTEDGPPVPWKMGRRRVVYIPSAGGGGGVFNPYYYQFLAGAA